MKQLQQLLIANRSRALALATRPVAVDASGGEATIYLYGSIFSNQADAEWWGGVAADKLVPELRSLNVDTIRLRINSPGGDVFGAQAIAQALRDSKAKVIAHVDGLAASAATVIAVAANEVEIADGGMFMVHRAWSIAFGNTNDMLDAAELLDKVDGTLAAQYAAKTGKPAADMLAMMDAETWLTGQEAVDAGFVDRISVAEDPAAKASAQWDLSAYARPPSAGAEPPQEPALQSQDHRLRQLQRVAVMDRAAMA